MKTLLDNIVKFEDFFINGNDITVSGNKEEHISVHKRYYDFDDTIIIYSINILNKKSKYEKEFSFYCEENNGDNIYNVIVKKKLERQTIGHVSYEFYYNLNLNNFLKSLIDIISKIKEINIENVHNYFVPGFVYEFISNDDDIGEIKSIINKTSNKYRLNFKRNTDEVSFFFEYKTSLEILIKLFNILIRGGI